MSETVARLIDRYNEIAGKAGYVIASFGLEIQDRDKRIAELEVVNTALREKLRNAQLLADEWEERYRECQKIRRDEANDRESD